MTEIAQRALGRGGGGCAKVANLKLALNYVLQLASHFLGTREVEQGIAVRTVKTGLGDELGSVECGGGGCEARKRQSKGNVGRTSQINCTLH